MKIGIDLHGVIDNDPEWFKNVLGWFFLDWDPIDVYIISGPPTDEIKAELDKYNIARHVHYDEIYSVVDYLKEKGIEMWLGERGSWWASDEEWWKAKAEICEKYGVDIMIDDKKEWGTCFKNIKTKFLLYGG